jgi:outer membrane protein assembly factor BamA
MIRRLLLISLAACSAAFGAPADTSAIPHTLTVRSIHIEGNNVTQPYVISREMSLHVGDTLSQKALDRDRDRIYSLELFNKVVISHSDSATMTDILVTVVERWYLIPSPMLSLRNRAVNTASYGIQLTDQNFLGRNERVSASFSAGYNRSAGLSYQTPRMRDTDDVYIRALLQYRDSHSLDYNSDVVFEQINRTASLSLGRRIGYYQSLIGTVGYQEWQIPDSSLGRTVSPDGTDRFLELGVEYAWDSRNVREYATDGSYADVSVTYDGIGGFSTVRNLRVVPDFRKYVLLSGNYTFAVRTFGSFIGGGPVPGYRLLFLSSRLGIRGYNPRQYSGEELAGASMELRLPLIAPRFVTLNFLSISQFNTMRFGVYAACFADVGKIWYGSDRFSQVPWLASAGVGLNFLLPYSSVLRPEFSVNALGQLMFGVNGGVAF